MRLAAVCGVVLGLAVAPAQACRLALLMAIDVSRSIDAGDYRIQRDGLLEAFADPAIRAAILGSRDPVALAIYEWSGTDHQELIVDWTILGRAADLAKVEAIIAARTAPPLRRATALGAALDYGRQVMDRAPLCAERVLDVSGDGRSNMGPSPKMSYERADWGGIRVNGLAIGEHERDLVAYYRKEVIRGAGAFVEDAPRQRDFPRAIRRKLLRELTEMMMGAAGPAAPRLR